MNLLNFGKKLEDSLENFKILSVLEEKLVDVFYEGSLQSLIKEEF